MTHDGEAYVIIEQENRCQFTQYLYDRFSLGIANRLEWIPLAAGGYSRSHFSNFTVKIVEKMAVNLATQEIVVITIKNNH